MNWGTRITILYLGFVALILTLAFTCFGQKVELESKDYYAKELKYQGQLDAMNNANALSASIQAIAKNKSVSLTIPTELLSPDFSGTITFFRPADSSQDKNAILKPDSLGKQEFHDETFMKGLYKIKISFISKGKTYYQESDIYF